MTVIFDFRNGTATIIEDPATSPELARLTREIAEAHRTR